MEFKDVDGHRIWYYDSEDPVISYLKNGILYGKNNFNLLDQFIEKTDGVVLDCGAHIGTFTAPCSEKYRTIAIEGAHKNIENLERTFEMYGNVHVIHAILSDSKKRCRFSTDGGPFGSIIEDANGDLESSVLDDIIFNPVVGIKMDLEGGEYEALLGARRILKEYSPPIVLEINGHCLRLNNKKPADIFNLLTSLNYQCYFMINKMILKINPNKIWPFCVYDIVALPKGTIQYSVRELTDYEINYLCVRGYEQSNEDCKNYYRSIMSEDTLSWTI